MAQWLLNKGIRKSDSRSASLNSIFSIRCNMADDSKVLQHLSYFIFYFLWSVILLMSCVLVAQAKENQIKILI